MSCKTNNNKIHILMKKYTTNRIIDPNQIEKVGLVWTFLCLNWTTYSKSRFFILQWYYYTRQILCILCIYPFAFGLIRVCIFIYMSALWQVTNVRYVFFSYNTYTFPLLTYILVSIISFVCMNILFLILPSKLSNNSPNNLIHMLLFSKIALIMILICLTLMFEICFAMLPYDMLNSYLLVLYFTSIWFYI